MDEDGFFAASHLAIVGLGLMGGSLAMALRGKCAGLLGIDPDPQTRNLASQLGIVDRVSAHGGELLPEAQVIILAAPVRAILSLLGELPRWHPGTAVVLDLGSTKRAILQAMQALPERFDPIGAHPMCGKEKSSLANADPALYRGATFALAPLPRTTARGREIALELVKLVGANPLWIDAETHDRWVAATSHLPYLAANALAAATPLEARPMLGPGLRSTTRLAGSSQTMMLDILTTNRENVQQALRDYRQALDALEQALASQDWKSLTERLAHGAEKYQQLIGE
jgi:prephenate dehydrogenase